MSMSIIEIPKGLEYDAVYIEKNITILRTKINIFITVTKYINVWFLFQKYLQSKQN